MNVATLSANVVTQSGALYTSMSHLAVKVHCRKQHDIFYCYGKLFNSLSFENVTWGQYFQRPLSYKIYFAENEHYCDCNM